MKKKSVEATAYGKALSIAKNIYGASESKDILCTLETIFPELRKSEDERMMNQLHRWMKEFGGAEEYTEKVYQWLRCLIEKQGEHAKFINKIQIGDKVTRNKDGVLVNLSQLKRVAKKDEKQGEQKPVSITDEWIENYWQHEKVNNPYSYDKGEEIQFDHQGFVRFCKKYCKGEQKPTEWHSEDEQNLNACLGFIPDEFLRRWLKDAVHVKYKEGNAVFEEEPYLETLDKAIELYYDTYGNGKGGFDNLSLEKFKDIVKTFVDDYGMKNHSWSKEDERLFQIVIDILDRENHLGNISHTDLIACVRKLKSFKPQPTWKPSDDEMEALANALGLAKSCGEENAFDLRTLYEKLKKLKN